jgi:mRNA interferase RelE/StbE
VASAAKLRVPEDVASLIRHSHPVLKRRIKEALKIIVADPESGKALTEELEGLRSFRVGRIRIIYQVSSRSRIDVVTIGPRKPYMKRPTGLLAENRS